jgi:uncharacterized protein
MSKFSLAGRFMFPSLVLLLASAQPILDAAAQGDITSVRVQIKRGHADARDEKRGSTALHNAAAQGHVDVCALLLKSGIAIDSTDFDGATPLVYAAYQGKTEVSKFLLSRGAKVRHVPVQGPTPLNAAILSQKLELVRLLIDAGANPLVKDFSENNAFDTARLAKQESVLELLNAKGQVK